MKHLLLITDNKGTRSVELHTAASSIGRDSQNSIVLHSIGVSRQHAIFSRITHPDREEHDFRITDGNLQGKSSTNGLFINGKQRMSRILRHGDKISFCPEAKACYFIVEEGADIEYLLSDAEDSVDCMLTMAGIPTAVESEEDSLDYSALVRLASFPELFIHPVVEVSLDGKVTYCNPASIQQFPEIQLQGLAHPVLSDVVEAATKHNKQQSVREISIGDRIFEQSLSYIPQSDLIRSYLVEITERKQSEDNLKALHKKLETEYEKRTLQLNEASIRLRLERKALTSSIATNRALINALPDPMFRISHVGNIVNSKAPKQHTLPFDPHNCINLNISVVLPNIAATDLQVCISEVLATEALQVLEFQVPTDKVTLYFEARVAVSAPSEVVVIIRDITERKRNEAEILGALDRERDLNEMKTRFVSMTSHEFRTPLTTIMSSAELLERYSDRWDTDKQTKYLHKVQTAARHMTELLNDVLLINKAEAGMVKFKPQPSYLNEFCQEIIEELQVTTDQHEIALQSQLSNIPMMIDRKLIRHILTNLLSNAVNYSPSGGEVVLSLEQTPDKIVMSVKDYGIGIPPESQATLFDSFVRGSNVGTISGTGLGLAIVKKSVDLHQGVIACQSTAGEGTTFIVQLPSSLLAIEE